MSAHIENLPNNEVKLTFEIPSDLMEQNIREIFLKNKDNIRFPGFRKKSVNLNVARHIYGSNFLVSNAFSKVSGEYVQKAIEETEIHPYHFHEAELANYKVGEPLQVSVVIELFTKVTLGEYKGLKVRDYDSSVTEDEVNTYLQNQATKNSRQVVVEDRGAEPGDVVTLDYVGTIDGAEFENGTVKDAQIQIGSHYPFAGFDDELIGAKAGDHLELELTLPEDYSDESLRGKDASFACDIKRVSYRDIPEIDDEFVSEISNCETVEQYKEQVRGAIGAQKRQEIQNAQLDMVIEQLLTNCKVELPASMIKEQIENEEQAQTENLKRSGINMDVYLQYIGIPDIGTFREVYLRPQAIQRLSYQFILHEIATAEALEISETELDSYYESEAKSRNVSVEEVRASYEDPDKLESLKARMLPIKAQDFVIANTVKLSEAEWEEFVKSQNAETTEEAPAQEEAVEAVPVQE